MTKETLNAQLWTPRAVDETVQIYADWAAQYDTDLAQSGYHTPRRLAAALAPYHMPGQKILDYGCGTGLMGAELSARGMGDLIDGTDITAEMVEIARSKGIYNHLWVGAPGASPAQPGAYAIIVAAGVISLGAAPADSFDLLLDALSPGAILGFSFNDPTLNDPSYMARLFARREAYEELFRAHGPHLDQAGMGSDVIILRRR